MHSFSITDHYFILIEQPLFVKINKVITNLMTGKPLVETLDWQQVEVISINNLYYGDLFFGPCILL